MDAVEKALRVAKQVGGGAAGAAGTAGGAAPDYTSFVTGLYQSELGRAPDPAGLQGWVNALQSGQLNQEQVRQGFVQSPENQVQNMYQELLRRDVDPAASAWAEGLASGQLTAEQVRQGIIGSPEYQSKYGSGGQQAPQQPVQRPNQQPSATPVDITKQGMPLIYTPAPYKDYGATAAAFRVASGLENLPAPFYTLSPVVGGTPAEGEGGTTGGGAAGGGAGGGTTGGGTQTPTYQQKLNEILKQQETQKPFQSSAMENYLTSLYRKELGRDPDPQGLKDWLGAISSGQMTAEQVRQAIIASPENQVQDLYLQYLKRSPDPAGLEGWVKALQSGQMSSQDIAKAIQNSPEATSGVLAQAYKDYLGRAPDPAGLREWQNAIANGQLTVQEAISGIANSPEAQGLGGAKTNTAANIVADAYRTYLGRAPEPGAEVWAQAIASNASTPEQVVAAIANSPEAAIRNAYVTYLGREPDPSSAAWSQALASGQLSMDQVISGIANSPEAQSRGFKSGGAVKNYEDGGAIAPNYDELVRAAYKDFLGRDPDPTGYSGWMQALQSGAISPTNFAEKFNAGYEDDVYRAYRDILGRDPDAEGMAGWINALQRGEITTAQLPELFKKSPENRQNEYYRELTKEVPTPDLYSEKQGGRMYNIDIGNVERMPELGRIAAPVNVKQQFENSEIARLQRELEAAKAESEAAAARSNTNTGGGGGGDGGSNFGAQDPSGTAGGIQSDPGGGAQGPSGVGEGTSGLWARGGRTGNNAIDNALRMIKADRR